GAMEAPPPRSPETEPVRSGPSIVENASANSAAGRSPDAEHELPHDERVQVGAPPPQSMAEPVPPNTPFPVGAVDALNELDMALPPRVQVQPGESGDASERAETPQDAAHEAPQEAEAGP